MRFAAATRQKVDKRSHGCRIAVESHGTSLTAGSDQASDAACAEYVYSTNRGVVGPGAVRIVSGFGEEMSGIRQDCSLTTSCRSGITLRISAAAHPGAERHFESALFTAQLHHSEAAVSSKSTLDFANSYTKCNDWNRSPGRKG
jgi:hypothetical protein